METCPYMSRNAEYDRRDLYSVVLPFHSIYFEPGNMAHKHSNTENHTDKDETHKQYH